MVDEDLKKLDPEDLKIDPVNERVSNPTPHSEDGESLQDSVQELGVIEPIVVRKVDGQYMVIAGQRRTLAAQAAGLDSIPARIVDIDDSEARIISIAENAEQFKKEVPPEDRAVSIKKLCEDGYSFEEIADRMGASEPTVRRWVEPALDYWEDTEFEAGLDDQSGEIGLDDISLRALQIIRSNTKTKDRRERIAKKVIGKNISNKLVEDAAKRSNSPKEFEKEIERTAEELESNVLRIREEAYFSGDIAEKIDDVLKNRGIGEQEAIESLVEERIEQLELQEEGKWVGLQIEEEIGQALHEAIGDSNVQPEDLIKVIVKKKLRETGYLD